MRTALITLAAVIAVAADARASVTIHPVAGHGVHFLSNVIVHATDVTPTGLIQRSTETVELSGDLQGRILYHPTTVIDFTDNTLVNTGHQVFSGTVLGSAPVLLHDDEFRFEADLVTGAVRGKVYLTDPIAGDKIRCDLDVVGTGLDAAGNATFTYTGQCRIRHKEEEAP
jgi:hypothetical protein